jgi:hypothetical protein
VATPGPPWGWWGGGGGGGGGAGGGTADTGRGKGNGWVHPRLSLEHLAKLGALVTAAVGHNKCNVRTCGYNKKGTDGCDINSDENTMIVEEQTRQQPAPWLTLILKPAQNKWTGNGRTRVANHMGRRRVGQDMSRGRGRGARRHGRWVASRKRSGSRVGVIMSK